MYRKFWLVLLLACSWTVSAGGPGGVRKQIESSMLVTGIVDIDPDGVVSSHSLDHADKLPPGVVELIGNALPGWKFEPILVDGSAVNARAQMSLRVIAKKLDGERYSIRIGGASFDQQKSMTDITAKQMKPPAYPSNLVRAGVAGTVYLVLRIGRDGLVHDAVAEQVNLKIVADEHQMRACRDLLAKASVAAAKRWSFTVHADAHAAEREFRSVRVPVAYWLDGAAPPKYGQWEAYVPGPRQPIPWMEKDDTAFSAADAYVAGSISQMDSGLRLLTPLKTG